MATMMIVVIPVTMYRHWPSTSLNSSDSKIAVAMYFPTSNNQSPIFSFHRVFIA